MPKASPLMLDSAPTGNPQRSRTNKKGRCNRSALRISGQPTSLPVGLSSLVRGHPQQMQQAGEQVVDAHIQRDRRHDVVGLAAMDDLAGLVQDQTAAQQD